MSKKLSGSVFLAPWILSLLLIIYLEIFSLEFLTPEGDWVEIIIGLFSYNIPLIVLLMILVISWKYEIVGVIAFFLAGLLYVTLNVVRFPDEWYMALAWTLPIGVPLFLISTLFLINWRKKVQLVKFFRTYTSDFKG